MNSIFSELFRPKIKNSDKLAGIEVRANAHFQEFNSFNLEDPNLEPSGKMDFYFSTPDPHALGEVRGYITERDKLSSLELSDKVLEIKEQLKKSLSSDK